MAARQKKLRAIVCTLVLLGGASLVRLAQANATAFAPQTQAPARRVVSLVPNVTEMLFAVGAGPQVVGVSSYDDFPPETKSLPRVGALLDPDTERILSLRPDLVIVYGSQSELEAQFTRAGIRVYAYRHGGIDNILQGIRDVARLTGHVAEGDRVMAGLRAQFEAVRTRVRGRPRPKTLLVIGRDPGSLRGLFVSGGVGFLHEVLDIAGGDDVFADVTRESVQPSTEAVIVRAPQVIVEVNREAPPPDVVAKERAVWQPLASIPAVRNNRVHLLYGAYLLSAGPRLSQAAEALARVLHPESFK